MMFGLMIISIVFGLIGAVVSNRLKKKFAEYSQMPNNTGMSGREVAAQMLQYYNIHDVQIIQGEGRLTDHYNPQNKTVSLSPEVYGGRSVAAAAVAAHEVGHAVQHAEAYAMLKFRSAIVPIVQISSSLQQYLFMFGFVMAGSMGSNTFLLIALAAFSVTALFSVVTLPVEFDASKRALAWLDAAGGMRMMEHDGAKDALHWAAMTYVVGALAAIAQLLYLALMFFGSKDD